MSGHSDEALHERIGSIYTLKHSRPPEAKGPALFTNVQVGRLEINNAGGKHPGSYIFNSTGLTFSDVTVTSAFPGTMVTINGETRSFG